MGTRDREPAPDARYFPNPQEDTMNWTEHDTPPANQPRVEDTLILSEKSHVRIIYLPYPMVFLSVGIEAEKVNPADRDGTRRMVLRELLPVAEAALTALRQAVAEEIRELPDYDPQPAIDAASNELTAR